jgi:putative colanic acid biosynthesis acetyltransferase WcaF
MFRAVWSMVWLIMAAWTPVYFQGWRRFLLRLFGAKISPTANIYPTARIWYPPNLEMHDHSCLGPRVTCYSMDRIVLGAKSVVSQGAHLCAGTHDISDPDFRLLHRPIHVGRDAWLAAESFVGPGVSIGEGAVLGARAVTFSDLEPWTVYAGNRAVKIKTRLLKSGGNR